MNACKVGSSGRPILRWAVNTAAWSPSRTEWVTAMRLVNSDEERQRINRFVFKRDAKHALVGRLLIRSCCRHYLDAEQQQQLFSSNKTSSFSPEVSSSEDQHRRPSLRMARSEKGKPMLLQTDSTGTESPYEAFHFNVSHSGDYCVLAAEPNTKIGVDLMKVEVSGGMGRLAGFFRSMTRQFSESEWRYIRSAEGGDESKLARFIRLWSLKEALVKAEGSGIILPLSRLSFACPTELVAPGQAMVTDSSVTVVNPGEGHRPLPEPWVFEECMLDRQHYVSVAKQVKQEGKDDDGDHHQNNNNNHHLGFEMLAIEDLLAEAQNLSLSPGQLCTHDDEKYWTDFCRKS